MNLKHQETFIFVKDWVVEKIAQVSREDIKKETGYIYVWYSDEVCPLKVGHVITLKDLSTLALINRPLLVEPEEMDYKDFKADFKARDQRREELIEGFSRVYKTLDLAPSKELVKRLREDREVFYRVFYNSLKMYRMRSYIFSLAQELIRLSGHEAKEKVPELLAQFKALNFDNVLVRSLEKTAGLGFCLPCNNPKVWAEEAVVMTGTFQLFLEAADFLRSFIKRLQEQKSFIHHQGFLDWDEAGAMETWTPLGALRNRNTYHELFK